ncbi:hypothetical protein FH972_023209 [Carpinus fangiana]|uniref:Transmembrane protein n=1 Tax=Carpinus fangiana TaxID=176857 RepID=A0A5N6KV02_9ROSI|nr:hypothetical protein FH972_023209 [Carpinus fangiana]
MPARDTILGVAPATFFTQIIINVLFSSIESPDSFPPNIFNANSPMDFCAVIPISLNHAVCSISESASIHSTSSGSDISLTSTQFAVSCILGWLGLLLFYITNHIMSLHGCVVYKTRAFGSALVTLCERAVCSVSVTEIWFEMVLQSIILWILELLRLTLVKISAWITGMLCSLHQTIMPICMSAAYCTFLVFSTVALTAVCIAGLYFNVATYVIGLPLDPNAPWHKHRCFSQQVPGAWPETSETVLPDNGNNQRYRERRKIQKLSYSLEISAHILSILVTVCRVGHFLLTAIITRVADVESDHHRANIVIPSGEEEHLLPSRKSGRELEHSVPRIMPEWTLEELRRFELENKLAAWREENLRRELTEPRQFQSRRSQFPHLCSVPQRPVYLRPEISSPPSQLVRPPPAPPAHFTISRIYSQNGVSVFLKNGMRGVDWITTYHQGQPPVEAVELQRTIVTQSRLPVSTGLPLSCVDVAGDKIPPPEIKTSEVTQPSLESLEVDNIAEMFGKMVVRDHQESVAENSPEGGANEVSKSRAMIPVPNDKQPTNPTGSVPAPIRIVVTSENEEEPNSSGRLCDHNPTRNHSHLATKQDPVPKPNPALNQVSAPIQKERTHVAAPSQRTSTVRPHSGKITKSSGKQTSQASKGYTSHIPASKRRTTKRPRSERLIASLTAALPTAPTAPPLPTDRTLNGHAPALINWITRAQRAWDAHVKPYKPAASAAVVAGNTPWLDAAQLRRFCNSPHIRPDARRFARFLAGLFADARASSPASLHAFAHDSRDGARTLMRAQALVWTLRREKVAQRAPVECDTRLDADAEMEVCNDEWCACKDETWCVIQEKLDEIRLRVEDLEEQIAAKKRPGGLGLEDRGWGFHEDGFPRGPPGDEEDPDSDLDDPILIA